MPTPTVWPTQVDITPFGLSLRSETVQVFELPSASQVTARVAADNAVALEVIVDVQP
jgi:hypothetical protein